MNRILLQIGVIAVVCGIGLGVWLVGCGGDKGVGPTEPKDYYVYFADGVDGEKYYRYHTGTGEVETFTLPYISWDCGLGISPNGETMYLKSEDRIVEVALDSLTVMGEHHTDIKHRLGSEPVSLEVSPESPSSARRVEEPE